MNVAGSSGMIANNRMNHLNCSKCRLHNRSLWDKEWLEMAEKDPEWTPDIPCTGTLIYSEWTRNNTFALGYDQWRSEWCNKYRNDGTPEGFREGEITIECLDFAMKRGYKPYLTVGQLVEIMNL